MSKNFQTAVENLISNLNISCGTYEMNCFLNQKKHLQGKSLFYVFLKKDLWWRSCLLNLLAQNLSFIWIGATLQMLYRKICKFFKKRYFLLFFFWRDLFVRGKVSCKLVFLFVSVFWRYMYSLGYLKPSFSFYLSFLVFGTDKSGNARSSHQRCSV